MSGDTHKVISTSFWSLGLVRGLIGGVMAGVMTAKGIAAGAGLPLIGVNHLEGHALTPRLTDGLDWPSLLAAGDARSLSLIEKPSR